MDLIFWIALLLVSGAIELHTNALVGGFVALGSLVAFFAALSHVPFIGQAGIWLVVTIVSTVGLRPFALSKFGPRTPGDLLHPTTSPMAGLTGAVVEVVGDELHPGRVVVRGESWRAVTEGRALEPGSAVIVELVRGTTLWVRSATN